MTANIILLLHPVLDCSLKILPRVANSEEEKKGNKQMKSFWEVEDHNDDIKDLEEEINLLASKMVAKKEPLPQDSSESDSPMQKENKCSE